MRKLAVRTNWPTVALKPERKALKGYISDIQPPFPIITPHPSAIAAP